MTDQNDVAEPGSARGISLRLALQLLLSGAVIVAVGAVTMLINSEIDEVLHDLAESHVRIIAGGTAANINQQLAHVPRALEEFNFLKDLGDLDPIRATRFRGTPVLHPSSVRLPSKPHCRTAVTPLRTPV